MPNGRQRAITAATNGAGVQRVREREAQTMRFRRRGGARRTVALAGAGALAVALLPALTAQAQTGPQVRGIERVCPDGSSSTFRDVGSSVHADAIGCIADRGIALGTTGGEYRPRSSVQRDQMASFIVRWVEDYTGDELRRGEVGSFPDVPESNVHREAIDKLRTAGWVQGRASGDYDPTAAVTRGQMARFIAGALSFLDDGDGTNASAPPAAGSVAFPDTVGSVFRSDIDRLAEQGIVTGFEDGTYRANDAVLRDQMASFIARGYDYALEAELGADVDLPPEFQQTSRFVTRVDALQVTDGDDVRLGEDGASGVFDLRLDAVSDLICYDITLEGVSGDYASPALTATHIHEGGFGATGPARVAFADPVPVDADDPDGVRRSSGCVAAGDDAFPDDAEMDPDPGAGFTVAQLEAAPEAFYLDSHTEAFPGGAVRGQLGSTDVHDVALSWHDEVDDETGLFGAGEPGADGSALLVVSDGTDTAAGTAGDRICAALATDATGPFSGSPGAHLHVGDRDENGPVVVPFATPDDETGTSLSCTDEFLEGFEVADLRDDLEGYYVNLHSDAFPAGAVRGQLPFGTRIADDAVTSTFSVSADPDQVVGAGGEPGATATYELTLDSVNGIVCYEVLTNGVSGDYSSPAVTANHIHEAAAGVAGPPRVAFADPVPVDEGDPDGVRISSGCAVTPQLTGTAANGSDNGAGFDLADIESDPAAYYVDVHTEDFTPGAVRGQFADPFTVTSRFTVEADAAQVVDGGEPGATGTWQLRADRDLDLICYSIELDGVSGDYQSPASTATHIHEGVPGEAGPARVAFADPEPVDASDPDGIRRSSGCVDAGATSFPDGEMDPDPGLAFSVAALEDDPSDYYVDTHTVDFPAGAVRGQVGPASPIDLPPLLPPLPFGDGADATTSPAVAASAVTTRTTAPEGMQVSEFGCHFEPI